MLNSFFNAETLSMKVCGLTRAEDVEACLKIGIAATGFIFVPGSPRALSAEQAAALPHGKALRVGVFANAEADTALQIASQARLNLLQLHGGESLEYCQSLGAHNIIKVFWPDSMSVGELQIALDNFAPYCCAFLFDAGGKGGGSGAAFNWARLAGLHIPRPWILAGGLNSANIRQSVQECRPCALDLNSGVETAPGLKDITLIKKIKSILQGAE